MRSSLDPLSRHLRQRLRLRLEAPLQTTVARLFRWLDLEPPRGDAGVTAEPRPVTDLVADPRPTMRRLRAPTSFHDPDAEPIEVRVTQAVVDRLLGDVLDHVRSPRGEDETGWVPVGRVRGGVVEIEGLLPKGRGSRATPGEFEIDHGHVLAALSLAQTRRATQVVGLVHTHPGRMDYNSPTDLASDEAHVLTLPGGTGVYPVIVRERGEVDGHVLRTGLRLAWWGMRSTRPGVYAPCRVEVVPGSDVTTWLAEHEDALAAAGEPLLELLERQLEAVLVPAAAGAVDLVASLGSTSVVVRFEPDPTRVVLARGASRVSLTWEATRGRKLGRRIAEVLARPAVAATVGLHGAPLGAEESHVRPSPSRTFTEGTQSPTRRDRAGRSNGTTSKKFRHDPRTK